jgi:hypothetical protein
MWASASSVLAAKDGHLPSSPVFESSDGLATGEQRKHKLAERNGRSSTSAVPDRNHVVSVHRPRVSPASPWKQDPRPRARFEEHRVQRRRIPTLLHRAQSGPEPRGPTPCSSRSNRALWCGASERLDSPPFRAGRDSGPERRETRDWSKAGRLNRTAPGGLLSVRRGARPYASRTLIVLVRARGVRRELPLELRPPARLVG